MSSCPPIIVIGRAPRRNGLLGDANVISLDSAVPSPALISVLHVAARALHDRQALQRNEQRFATFMQHLPGLAWIKELDGRYTYVNAAAERAFRTPAAELYGKRDDEIFPRRPRAPSPPTTGAPSKISARC